MGFGIEPTYDQIEYVSPTRQKIKKLLGEWSQEIREARKGQLSEQKAAALKREGRELSRIINILSEVSIIRERLRQNAFCQLVEAFVELTRNFDHQIPLPPHSPKLTTVENHSFSVYANDNALDFRENIDNAISNSKRF
jgi:hypothetical protein